MVLGLTANPGSSERKILEICENLFIEHIEVRDEDDPDVKPYIKTIKVNRIYVNLPESYRNILRYLRDMLIHKLKALHSMKIITKDPMYVYKSDLIEAGEYIPPKTLTRLSEDIERELQLIDEIDMKIFDRDVKHASRELLSYILENGSKGMKIDDLINEYREEYPESMVKAALSRLEDKKQIETIDKTVYPKGISYKKMMYGDIHIVGIEKIFRGGAITIIDDKWRAVLYPVNYSGPRYLLKRGRRFKALSKLYRLNGKLHIKIYDILELEKR